MILGTLGTLLVFIFPSYTIVTMFSVLSLLMIMQRLNLYKLAMLTKQLARNTKKLYVENKLNLRTGYRSYNDNDLEGCRSTRCL